MLRRGRGPHTGTSVSAYLVIFLASAGTTFALTPVVRRLAIRGGAISQPNDRTVHATPTPTMGGIAMYAGFLVAMGMAFVLLLMIYINVMDFVNPINVTIP